MIVKLHNNANLSSNFSFFTSPSIHLPRILQLGMGFFLGLVGIVTPLKAQTIEARPSVQGVLRDHRQLPVIDAEIFIKSSAGNASIYSKTDHEGRFQAYDLPLGNITVVARDPVSQALSMVQAQLQRPEQQLPMDLQVARADARVEGVVMHAGKPVADANITLLSKQVFSDVGVAQRVAKTDANGHFKIEKAMLGTLRLIAEADGMVSQHEVETVSGNTQHVQIALGNSAHLPNVLTGEDGSSFEIDWTLALVNGSGLSQPAYQNAYSLQINGWNLPGIPAATKLNGGRELRLEAVTVDGIDVSRQIFMPGMGSYVRYLDVLRNTGQSEANVQVEVVGLLGTSERTTLLSNPDQTA